MHCPRQKKRMVNSIDGLLMTGPLNCAHLKQSHSPCHQSCCYETLEPKE